MENHDVVILGSGPGGYVTAIRASQLGFNTAIIEKESLGGICLNWGCIPTKALLKSAEVYDYLNHAESYGIEVENFSKNFEKVIKRSRTVAGTMSKGVNFLMKKNKIKVYSGFGKLNSDKTITVTKDEKTTNVSAEHIIIATGARSRDIAYLKKDGEKINKGKSIHKDFRFKPDELVYQKNSTNLMTLPELHTFVKKEQIKGAQNIHFYFLDLYQRYSNPFTTFILTIIGFSVAIHKKRGGIGVNLVYGFGLTTLFILFQKISITFTTNSDLHPLIAILLPNIIFGFFAYYLFRKAER